MDAFVFDIDDTLFDSSRAASHARRHAIEAMVDAGLPCDQETAKAMLQQVIAEHGSNYNRHFDEMLDRLHIPEPRGRLIAAGVVAYHNTKLAFLRPFEETIPTLLRLRDLGFALGVITDGKAVKQWEKLIRLGLQHFFQAVVISEELGLEKPHPELFHSCCRRLGAKEADSVYIGNDPRRDIAGANGVGMTTVRIRKGKYADEETTVEQCQANFEIGNLRQLLALVSEQNWHATV